MSKSTIKFLCCSPSVDG